MSNNVEWIKGPAVSLPGFDVKNINGNILKKMHDHDFVEQKMYKGMYSALQLKDVYATQYCESGVYGYLVDDTNYADMINEKKLPLPAMITEGSDIPRLTPYAIKGETGTLTKYGVSCEFLKSVWDNPEQTALISKTYDMASYTMSWMLDTLMLDTIIENAGAPVINLADGTWDSPSEKINIDMKNIIKSFRRQQDKKWMYNVTNLFMDYESLDCAENFYDAYDKNTWNDGYVEGIHVSELDYLNDLFESGNIPVDNGVGLWYDSRVKPAMLYYRNPNSNINRTGMIVGSEGVSRVNVQDNPSIIDIKAGVKDKDLNAERITVEFTMEVGIAVVQPKAIGFMTGFLTPKNNSNKSNINKKSNK